MLLLLLSQPGGTKYFLQNLHSCSKIHKEIKNPFSNLKLDMTLESASVLLLSRGKQRKNHSSTTQYQCSKVNVLVRLLPDPYQNQIKL